MSCLYLANCHSVFKIGFQKTYSCPCYFQIPFLYFKSTVETGLKQPLKIDKTKILKPCDTLMQVKQNAPQEYSAILLTCIKLLSVWKTHFFSSFEWLLKAGFTVYIHSTMNLKINSFYNIFYRQVDMVVALALLYLEGFMPCIPT